MSQAAIGRYRWTICSLLFFATTINYLDRQVISLIVEDYLVPEFKWTETDYANLTVAFQLAYAVAMFGVGRLIDKLGTKIGYAMSLLLWSIAAMGHALIRTTTGFFVARAALGVTEAGNFPAAIKTVAEWFPKRSAHWLQAYSIPEPISAPSLRRSLFPSLQRNGVGEWAFFITGAVGLIWLIFWFWLYEVPKRQKRLGKPEFDYIHSDTDEAVAVAAAQEAPSQRISWGQLLGFKQTWAFALGKFLTDGIWWFYLFWLPEILKAAVCAHKEDIALPVALVYTIAIFWKHFRGMAATEFDKGRLGCFQGAQDLHAYICLLRCRLFLRSYAGRYNMWLCRHDDWICCFGSPGLERQYFHYCLGYVSKRGCWHRHGHWRHGWRVGRHPYSKSAGYLFDHYKALGHIQTGYLIMFFICGSAYLIAWLVMHFLVPRMKPVNL